MTVSTVTPCSQPPDSFVKVQALCFSDLNSVSWESSKRKRGKGENFDQLQLRSLLQSESQLSRILQAHIYAEIRIEERDCSNAVEEAAKKSLAHLQGLDSGPEHFNWRSVWQLSDNHRHRVKGYKNCSAFFIIKGKHIASQHHKEGSELSGFVDSNVVVQAFLSVVPCEGCSLDDSAAGTFSASKPSSKADLTSGCHSVVPGHVVMENTRISHSPGPSKNRGFSHCLQITDMTVQCEGHSEKQTITSEDSAANFQTKCVQPALNSQTSTCEYERTEARGTVLEAEKESVWARNCRHEGQLPSSSATFKMEGDGLEAVMNSESLSCSGYSAQKDMSVAPTTELVPGEEGVQEALRVGLPGMVDKADEQSRLSWGCSEGEMVCKNEDISVSSDIGNKKDKVLKGLKKIEAPSNETVLEEGSFVNASLEMFVSPEKPGSCVNLTYNSWSHLPSNCPALSEKFCSQQNSSQSSFKEDCEGIRFSAVKYEQNFLKARNDTQTLSHQEKHQLDQRVTKGEMIVHGPKRLSNNENQDTRSLCKVKIEEASEETSMGVSLERNTMHVSLGVACHGVSVANDHIQKHELDIFSMGFFPNDGILPTLGDAQASTMKKEIQNCRTFIGPSSVRSSSSSKNYLPQDAAVEIIEHTVSEDVRFDSEDQATECSTSFEGTQNSEKGCVVLDEREENDEAQSLVRDGNSAMEPAFSSQPVKRKKTLNLEWKAYRRGIEWRCHWLELRIKELQTQAAKYDQALLHLRSRKNLMFKQRHLVPSAARMIPLVDSGQKKRILRIIKRRRRRKVEDVVDLPSCMSRHPLFSRYEKKKKREQEEISGEEATNIQQVQLVQTECSMADSYMQEEQDYDEEIEEDGLNSGHDSMEQLLWNIEVLQMHIVKLKNQLSKGASVCRKAMKFSVKDLVISSPQSLCHPSPFSSLRDLRDNHSESPGVQSGIQPSLSGPSSKFYTSSFLSGRQGSDCDINNVAMLGNVMTTYVEPARHAYIDTPQWRMMEELATPFEAGSSEEDTDDEQYSSCHAKMEVKERQQRYASCSSMFSGEASPKTGVKGLGKNLGKGNGSVPSGITTGDVCCSPLSFGFVPKGKRRKRQSKDPPTIAKNLGPVSSQFTVPLQTCTQAFEDTF